MLAKNPFHQGRVSQASRPSRRRRRRGWSALTALRGFGFARYYLEPEANRKPFDPRIDREVLLKLDGHDNVGSAIMDAVDSNLLLVGLVDRIDESAPAHERKAREERERPNSERHNLRESLENAHVAHEAFAEPSDVPDASEAFRQQAPLNSHV